MKLDKRLLAMLLIAVAAVAVLLLSILVLKEPWILSLLVVLLEIGIAFCMHKAPLYLHVGVVAAEVILGVATKNILFLIFGAAVYFCGVLSFHILLRQEERPRKTAKAE